MAAEVKPRRTLRWMMFCLAVVPISELLSGQFSSSNGFQPVLRYVLPVVFSVIGILLLFIAAYQERASR
jgi:hypothetical protein